MQRGGGFRGGGERMGSFGGSPNFNRRIMTSHRHHHHRPYYGFGRRRGYYGYGRSPMSSIIGLIIFVIFFSIISGGNYLVIIIIIIIAAVIYQNKSKSKSRYPSNHPPRQVQSQQRISPVQTKKPPSFT